MVLYQFLVADIGEDDIILGYLFFEGANPQIDWSMGNIKGNISLKGTAILDEQTTWATMFPEWEEGDQIWLRTTIRKTMVAQQLVEKATDKWKKTWQELVPKCYYEFGKVFSKAASERFPE
jgi:predicted DNA-binding protein YlxM (UPF0122 family)